MAAPVGNDFWKQVKNPTGRPAAFATPGDLWDIAIKYFTWVSANPLYESKLYGGDGKIAKLPKMRAMTEKAFCLWCGISEQTFRNYKKEPIESNEANAKDFFEVAKRISDIIYTQKFEGAAGDFLNPNIISRDLGLIDKSETDLKLPSAIRIIRDKEI